MGTHSRPNDLNGPMALHLDGLGVQPMTWQAFVNGQAVGDQGFARIQSISTQSAEDIAQAAQALRTLES
jgi:hypothetical protein